MIKSLKASIMLLCALFISSAQSASLDYYFPEQPTYQTHVPTPQSVIGFHVGDRHVRHDQLLAYFDALANSSNKVELQHMGMTNEHRKQVVAVISSEKNLQNLDQILQQRRNNLSPNDNEPVVVWLGYSIHGNEISGANASMLVAYYLAATNTDYTKTLLDNVIVVIEPSMNPDGMDLFTTWVNSNRNASLNTDPAHRTHHRQWPSGRTNHYMFDLNRDWLPLTQVESRNRVRTFHHFKPNVLADFHEMGKDSSYFFQPGVPSRTNPLTPAKNIELTQIFATYHADALDQENRLYYSQESFDDFYYGKGSTYPDINGTVGILFEQASSRGFATDSINGVLTFSYGIKNHVLTSFSTLKAAVENKAALQQFRYDFYQQNLRLADDESSDGFVISAPNDSHRLNEFLHLLAQHEINAYALTRDYQEDDDEALFVANQSYFVPYNQPQYRLIKTIFEKVTSFRNNTFYDVSGWTLPLAFDLVSNSVKSRNLKFSNNAWHKTQANRQPLNSDLQAKEAYAYTFSWQHYLAPKLLNRLLNQGIKARVASQSFSQMVNGQKMDFAAGQIVIPKGIQTVDNWFELLNQTQQDFDIAVYPLQSGLTPIGIELGSPSMRPVNPVQVLMVGGQGVTPNEAGHMLNYLDNTLGVPVSIVEMYRLHQIDFNHYTHVIFVDGRYQQLSQTTLDKLGHWLSNGGVIYAQRRGASFLANKGLLKVETVKANELNGLFDTSQYTYADKQQHGAQQRIAGTIFSTTLDTSHPLGFGFNDQNLPIFKNSTVIIKQPNAPFVTVSRFNQAPLLSGYSAPQMTNMVANNAAIVAHNVGRGRIIASSENLVFRGYWLGTSKIVANALFFAKAFSANAPIIEPANPKHYF
ncbi:M14 family zinc carboxypeptidase [Thalassotalea aquiviva]|uniref:M14 family zinc carboxypeptidase n=1 Tax=Thalassotalea aquiviva TaxID=3242415 RepID=UPI00352A74C2